EETHAVGEHDVAGHRLLEAAEPAGRAVDRNALPRVVRESRPDLLVVLQTAERLHLVVAREKLRENPGARDAVGRQRATHDGDFHPRADSIVARNRVSSLTAAGVVMWMRRR